MPYFHFWEVLCTSEELYTSLATFTVIQSFYSFSLLPVIYFLRLLAFSFLQFEPAYDFDGRTSFMGTTVAQSQ